MEKAITPSGSDSCITYVPLYRSPDGFSVLEMVPTVVNSILAKISVPENVTVMVSPTFAQDESALDEMMDISTKSGGPTS